MIDIIFFCAWILEDAKALTQLITEKLMTKNWLNFLHACGLRKLMTEKFDYKKHYNYFI